MRVGSPTEVPDSSKIFRDTVFYQNNKHISETWVHIKEIYPVPDCKLERMYSSPVVPLLPEQFTLNQFSQGLHYECFMQSLLAVLIRFPALVKRCFVTQNVREDGRYTFQFYRGKNWIMIEIDDTIPVEDGEVLYMRSPTEHWWPLLLEKAYAKFYTAYDHLEGCTLQEAFHDFTGNPVLNIPTERKLAEVLNVNITSSEYWLSVGKGIRRGDYAASVLTKDMPLEVHGIQSDQYYSIVDVFEVTRGELSGEVRKEEHLLKKDVLPSEDSNDAKGILESESKARLASRRMSSLTRYPVSVSQTVVKLYNPFEDDEYCGPLCASDSFWSTVVFSKTLSTSSFTVEKYLAEAASPRFIHVPLTQFLQWTAYVQLCLIGLVDENATYFSEEWKGLTAGGNPTFTSWRHNPIFLLQNDGKRPISLVASLSQEDQRRFTAPDEYTKYVQCGITLSQCIATDVSFPTRWITLNNHRAIQKSLFFNSREVNMVVTIPPASRCYLVPSTMNKDTEAQFLLGFYRLKAFKDYKCLSITKLYIPSVPFFHPLEKMLEVKEHCCVRADFISNGSCDMHLIVRQLKSYISQSGGDSKAQDYLGVYVYNADNVRLTSASGDGATNYREIGLLYHLPSEGRYTIAITCPRMKSDGPSVPVQVLLACSSTSAPSVFREANSQQEVRKGYTSFSSFSTAEPTDIAEVAWMDVPADTPPIQELLSLVKPSVTDGEGGTLFFPFLELGSHTTSKEEKNDGMSMALESGSGSIGVPLLEADEDDFTSLSASFVKKQYHGELSPDGHRILRTRVEDAGGQFFRAERRATLQSWEAPQYHSEDKEEDGGEVPSLIEKKMPSSGIEMSERYAKKRKWLERMKSEPELYVEAIKRLEAELEEEDKWHSRMKTKRSSYLKESYEGMAVKLLNLEDDEIFLLAEREYARRMEKGNESDCFSPLEMLHERAGKLAQELSQEDRRSYLTEMVEGIPLERLHEALTKDEPFHTLETERAEIVSEECVSHFSSRMDAQLSSTSEREEVKGRERKAELEEQLMQRAKWIASEMHRRERMFLDTDSLGFDVEALPLNDDEKFLALEDAARMVDETGISVKAKEARVIDLREKLQARATELGWAMRKQYLEATPEGMPLESLGLENEPVFLEKEAVRAELARQLLSFSESPQNHGTVDVPSSSGDQNEKQSVSKEQLQQELKEVDAALNAMVQEIAVRRNRDTRYFLPQEPNGVKLCYVPYAKDAKFCDLESVLRNLKEEEHPNKYQIAEMEQQMIRRVEELAQKVKMVDLEGLPDSCLGIPLKLLDPHKDARFNRLAEELRDVKKMPEKTLDRLHICDRMASLLPVIAEVYYAKDREEYMSPEPLGVPIQLLFFSRDTGFKEKEIQRMRLKLEDARRNAPMIRQLETELNARAEKIAKAHIQGEMEGILHNPEELPRELLQPYKDPIFFAEVQKMRELRLYQSSKPEVAPIKEAMNKRLIELARKLLESDRDYLIPDPKGVPFSLLPFSTDPEFRLTEARRMMLKIENPLRNADQIREMEEKLNHRASELAEWQLRLDMQGMDREPEGLPLPVLKLYTLDEFNEYVHIHRMTTSTYDRDNARKKMNELAHRIARDLRLQCRKSVLKSDPEGVSLDLLPLSEDDTYRQLEVRCTHLTTADPERYAKAIEELSAEMNKRVRELALAQKEEDLRAVEAHPLGIPLALLRPHEDTEMLELIQQLRVEKAIDSEKKEKERKEMQMLQRRSSSVMSSSRRSTVYESGTSHLSRPGSIKGRRRTSVVPVVEVSEDSETVKALQQRMSERAKQLAKVWIKRDYLCPSSTEVPVEALPLDADAEFHTLEVERAVLEIREGSKAAKKIKALEEKLSRAADRMIRMQMELDLASVPDMVSFVPKYVIDLYGNQRAGNIISELRELRRNPETNEEMIRLLEKELKDIAETIATHVRVHDRSYLAPRPLEVPLDDLPLDKDEAFKVLEGKRAALKSSKQLNVIQITAVEMALNDRCVELARNVMDEDLKLFQTEYEGISTVSIHPHDNLGFREAVEKLREGKRDPSVFVDPSLKRIAVSILSELALEKKYGEYYFLETCPEGLPLEEIPFSEDEVFQKLMNRRAVIRSTSPLEKRETILDLEEQMNNRTVELAKHVLEEDLEEIDPVPLGIPLKLLQPRKDAEISRLIPQLRRAKKTAYLRGRKSALVLQINQRVRELAHAALREGQHSYLDTDPAGVPLELLNVEEDPDFRSMQRERAICRLSCSPGDAETVKDLEHRLNLRTRELAYEQLERDLQGIDPNPEGVPIKLLNPHTDLRFSSLVSEDRLLKRDPIHNAEAIRQHEEVMATRTRELAHQLLKDHRGFLEPEPLGVPLLDLPLETDMAFHHLEVEHLTEILSRNPDKGKVMRIQRELSKRLTELAEEQQQNDLAGINPLPLGVPLALLQPHQDEKFRAFIPEVRRLTKDLSRNSGKLKAVREKIDARVKEMAEEFLSKDRRSYLEELPAGIPWSTLQLNRQEAFKELENKKLALYVQVPPAPQEEIEEIESSLNSMVVEIAWNQVRNDRLWLFPSPGGVRLGLLPLDTDPIFSELELARSTAKHKRAQMLVADLEDQLNARAQELAREKKMEELRELEQNPRGIPLTTIRPHEDSEFHRLITELRELRSLSERDASWEENVANLLDRLNARMLELCDQMMASERGYLRAKPNGIPLRSLRLDEDPIFREKEALRLTLKLDNPKNNAQRVLGLEEQLNERASQLANELIEKDFEGLQPNCRGIPINLINLHKEESFLSLIEEKRRIPPEDLTPHHPVVEALNALIDRIVDGIIKNDRDYLDREPEGILSRMLPIDTDDAFKGMEMERTILKASDAKRNAGVIAELEAQLNARAHELAYDVLAADRHNYLSPTPDEFSLSDSTLRRDAKFHQMEVDRARLKAKDFASNMQRIRELEIRLNDRVAELAKKQLEEDLFGLDRQPEGYPLAYLSPHQDEEFSRWVPDLRQAKKKKNAATVREIHDILNERVHALARERILAERSVLDDMPEGVPLSLLPLDTDAEFTTIEKELRLWRSTEKKGENTIREAERLMNKRVHQLAKELLTTSRDFLEQEPVGIPISEIRIDADDQFRELEVQRLRLLSSLSADPKEVAALEEQLHHRLLELAAEEKRSSRDYLNAFSHGIPKEYIMLDENPAFLRQEAELRRARIAPSKRSESVSFLERELQQLADEIALEQVRGNRKHYVRMEVEGLELSDIPLNSDAQFIGMEVMRAIFLVKDPLAGMSKIIELEGKLSERAMELISHHIQMERKGYIPREIFGIPVEEIPLNQDELFLSLEGERRREKRIGSRGAVMEMNEKLRKRAQELAEEVVVQDLSMLQEMYHNIPKSELNLHADSKFREMANKRRWRKGKAKIGSHELAQMEEQMNQRAKELAEAMIEAERAFLDRAPEGMALEDLPLDTDTAFHQMEAEYHRRLQHSPSNPLEGVVQELQKRMNDRAHFLARQEFEKRRGFLDPEPRGIPLADLALDEDPEFKQNEIALYAYYRNPRDLNNISVSHTELEEKMSARVYELARAMLAEDLRFLDQEPEGIPLDKLRLEDDEEFTELARERRRRRKGLKSHMDQEKVAFAEEKMRHRAQEVAKLFLRKERSFLPPSPEGIPLDDLPLHSDAEFHRLERMHLLLKDRTDVKPEKIKEIENALEKRLEGLARQVHRLERTFLDQEPMGILLEELPLNKDSVLQPLEVERRELLKKPKRYTEDLIKLEDRIVDRVQEIVRQYISEERAFMDPEPMGVPLRYLPLNADTEFHALEMELRKLRRNQSVGDAQRNEAIKKLKKRIDSRAKALAKELVEKGRRFLDPEPLGVPIADVPLNGDELFRHLEEQRRALKQDGKANSSQIKALEQRLNDRSVQLAQQLLQNEREFMNQHPFGIPLPSLPLSEDAVLKDLERQRRRLRKDPSAHEPPRATQISALEDKIEQRVMDIARQELVKDRQYLAAEPCGVPLQDLGLDDDAIFHAMEVERYELKYYGRSRHKVSQLEEALNERAVVLANALVNKERYYLNPLPEGIPLQELPLDTDPEFHRMELEHRSLLTSTGRRHRGNLEMLEEKMNVRVQELALAMRGWQDMPFHEANRNVAEEWRRVGALFPEGYQSRLSAGSVNGLDVTSVPGDAGFLVPFIAVLSLHPILLKRLLVTTEHPINGPYTFVFFDPNSNPVYVDIDDRVPCNAEGNPKFMCSTRRSWFPLLLEKAYAKFIGGYRQFDNCTPHETLRDLTGRPVTHIPLEWKLAKACRIGNYRSIEFWREIKEAMNRGDVFTCMSGKGSIVEEGGIHPLCCYAILGVYEVFEPESDSNSGHRGNGTRPKSSTSKKRDESREAAVPIDMTIKLHNAYRGYPPHYCGPLCQEDPRWNDDLRQQCQCEHNREEVLVLPLTIFLSYFTSVQRCHINCGDRLTANGVWDKSSAGGTPKFTTFRENPIFLVENKSTRPSTILAELRHHEPLEVAKDGSVVYPSTGIALLEPLSYTAPPTPLITNSTHRFLQKGVMLDSREVCYVMELPPNSTSSIVPYTKKPNIHGAFSISIYPGMAKVTLTPLFHAGVGKQPLSQRVTLVPGDPGQRVDLYVGEPSDVHVLVHQDKVSDPRLVAHGDIVAEDDIAIAAFSEEGVQVTNSGMSTNAREHSIVFQAKQSSRFPILLVCPSRPVSGDCLCTLYVYLKRGVKGKLCPSPQGAPPLTFFYMPRIPTALKSRGRSGRDARFSGANVEKNADESRNGTQKSKEKGPYTIKERSKSKSPGDAVSPISGISSILAPLPAAPVQNSK